MVDDLDLESMSIPPHETHAILLVNSNTVLSSAVAAKRFHLISRRHFQVIERDRGVQNREFLEGS